MILFPRRVKASPWGRKGGPQPEEEIPRFSSAGDYDVNHVKGLERGGLDCFKAGGVFRCCVVSRVKLFWLRKVGKD